MSDDLFDDFDGLDPDKALNHMGHPSVHKWEGTLLRMLQSVRVALKRKKLSDAEIERVAAPVVMQLCDTLGGSVGYIPRGAAVKKALRDERMFVDWAGSATERGMTPPELARKYRMATQSAYEIIARQRELHRRAEPDLFGYKDEGEKE